MRGGRGAIRVVGIVALLLAHLVVSLSVAGAHLVQTATLTASDAAIDTLFGGSISVSVDGSTAIIGPLSATYAFTESGTNWVQQQKLIANDAQGADLFGNSVSVSADGNIALIGAPGKDAGTGVAYIFARSGATWTQQQELTAGDGAVSDHFEWSVAMSGDGNTAVIGAFGRNSSAGGTYIFVRNGATWMVQQELACGVAANDYCGASVSVNGDGNTAVIGA